MSKGLVYYTDNQCSEKILTAVRNQLAKCQGVMPLVSVSQIKIPFGNNIVMPIGRSTLSMFRQILSGLEHIKSDFVFLVEHDVIYHPSHFEFTPLRNDIYYFNTNVWSLDVRTGKSLHYNGMRKTSGLVGNRDLLIQHFDKKIKRIIKDGRFTKRVGYEPGKSIKRGGVDNFDREDFKSTHPNIDLRHGNNLIRTRWNIEDYRSRNSMRDSWEISDGIPFWGKTRGRVPQFLEQFFDN